MTTCCCFSCISTGTLGLVEEMGRFSHVAEPGCICFNPCTMNIAGRQTLRVQQLSVQVPTKSKDNVVVNLKIVVQFRVLPDKVEDAFYKFSNPTAQISSFVINVVRGQAPNHNLDEIFMLRDELQKEVKNELDHLLDKYGFVLVAALICDIAPADSVREAMNQINTNARLLIAQQHKSEAEKYTLIKAAEADAEAKRLSGVGMAEQRKAAISGLQSSVANFQAKVPGMTAHDIMSLLLMNQYFDCIKDIASEKQGSTTIFMPHSQSQDVAQGVIAAGAAVSGGGGLASPASGVSRRF